MRKRMLAGITKVLIATDCRDVPADQKANGQMGTYLGRFVIFPYTGKRYRGPRQSGGNPVFLLPDGSKVWGYECWWVRP